MGWGRAPPPRPERRRCCLGPSLPASAALLGLLGLLASGFLGGCLLAGGLFGRGLGGGRLAGGLSLRGGLGGSLRRGQAAASAAAFCSATRRASTCTALR